MAGAADLEGLTRTWAPGLFSISRGRKVNAVINAVAKVRGIPCKIFHVDNVGWEIDAWSPIDEGTFGQPLGPYPTKEAAWLALQIIKD